MTAEQELKNLQWKFDYLQNIVAQDHARVDELVKNMATLLGAQTETEKK